MDNTGHPDNRGIILAETGRLSHGRSRATRGHCLHDRRSLTNRASRKVRLVPCRDTVCGPGLSLRIRSVFLKHSDRWLSQIRGTEFKDYRAIGSAEALMAKASEIGQQHRL